MQPQGQLPEKVVILLLLKENISSTTYLFATPFENYEILSRNLKFYWGKWLRKARALVEYCLKHNRKMALSILSSHGSSRRMKLQTRLKECDIKKAKDWLIKGLTYQIRMCSLCASPSTKLRTFDWIQDLSRWNKTTVKITCFCCNVLTWKRRFLQ